MSSQPSTRYCRGCNMEVRDEEFGDYKQCGECRLKAITRKRKSVTCDCGRTLLACSLKVHLRSIYHAEHIVQPVLPQTPLPVKKLPPPSKPVITAALRKPTAELIKQPQPRPVTVQPRPTTLEPRPVTLQPRPAAPPVNANKVPPAVRP
jgi:hypothetical protein